MMFLRVITARDWPCVSNLRLVHRILKQHSVPRVIETAKFPDRTDFLRLLMILQPAERANVACHLRARSCTRIIRFIPVLFFFVSTLSWGVDPSTYISQYRHTAWTMKDGLLRGQPNVITQTKDGYIWIGTAAGLMRFDGVRLVPWEPPTGAQLPSPNITALLAARDGSLCIGTDAGLSHWTHQNLVTYLKESSLVSSILEDRLGTIWITRSRLANPTDSPLCRVSGSKPQCYWKDGELQTMNARNGLPCDDIFSIVSDQIPRTLLINASVELETRQVGASRESLRRDVHI